MACAWPASHEFRAAGSAILTATQYRATADISARLVCGPASTPPCLFKLTGN
jgi:hypothetical protein